MTPGLPFTGAAEVIAAIGAIGCFGVADIYLTSIIPRVDGVREGNPLVRYAGGKLGWRNAMVVLAIVKAIIIAKTIAEGWGSVWAFIAAYGYFAVLAHARGHYISRKRSVKEITEQ